MKKTGQNTFIHSVKVPRLYKIASVIVRKVVEEGDSLKNLIYNSNHKNIKGIYALVVETIKHSSELDKFLRKSKLLLNEYGLQPWLAKILLTELIYGKKVLKGNSKPVLTILRYKNKFEKFLKSENINSDVTTVSKPRYVRVNTLRHTPDEVIKLFRKDGWCFLNLPADYSEFINTISSLKNNCFTRDFHIKELLIFPKNVQLYTNPLFINGSILLQDKASCFPAFLLNPKLNSVALDMCAAPGMKTTHLCALMKNKGKIYAIEANTDRFKTLCKIIQNAGCNNVIPIKMDVLNLKSIERFSWMQDVEYILVDPSCSGSGIVERLNIFRSEKNDAKRLKKLRSFQLKILTHALINFPNVKRVVYSTCSVQPEENEKVIEDVLNKLSNLTEPKFRLVECLKNTWPRRGSDEYPHGKFCIFSDPEKDLTNGFFVAVFERSKAGGSDSEESGGLNENAGNESSKKSKFKRKSNDFENLSVVKFKKVKKTSSVEVNTDAKKL